MIWRLRHSPFLKHFAASPINERNSESNSPLNIVDVVVAPRECII